MVVLKGAFATLLAVSLAVFAAIATRTLLYPHEVVVSEGAVRLATESWAQGRPLWAPDRLTEPPFTVAHYTPLYYLFTRAAQTIAGDGFAGGRAVSILFTLLTGAAAAWIARRETGRAWAGYVAGAVWLSFHVVAFWGTSHRVDAPAIFFEAVGIGVYLAARRAGRPGYEAVPWFVAAWCAKQVMVVGLLAVLVDLALDRRTGPRVAARFAALGWGPILGLFALWTWWSDGGFWSATVLGTISPHADAPWVIVSNAERFFGSPWALATFLAGIAAAVFFPRHRLLGIYLLVGIALAIATDANFPRFFPPALASAILVGILLAELEAHPRVNRFALASLTLLAFANLGWEMRPLFRERVLQLTATNTRLDAAAWLKERTAPGAPILAQDVGLLLSAERPVTVADPLVMSILVGNGAWDPEILAAGLRAREYHAVVLNRPVESLDDREWTTLWISGPARRELAERYRLAGTFTIGESWVFLEPTRYLYVPRETP